MKYFTKELWLGWNDQGRLSSQEALELGRQSFKEYAQQLASLRPRLGDRVYRFFATENLHDGRVLSFTVGDEIDHEVGGTKGFNINARNTSVRIKVFGDNLDVLYTLKYKKVRKVLFDFPSEEPLFYDEGGHIGDWGYDEISAANDQYLRHEVLFSSGTSILIEFKKFSYEKEKIKGTRYILHSAGTNDDNQTSRKRGTKT